MKKRNKYIIGTFIILVCAILIFVLAKQTQSTPLKVNEVNIDGKVIQLTANKTDYSNYKELYGFKVYDNKSSFEIEIQNPDILTYKNIKIGDSADTLDFCEEVVPGIFCYETNYMHKGYHLKIWYGIYPFDNTILTITYEYY